MLSFILSMWLKYHDCIFFLLNRIIIKMFYSIKVSYRSIFNVWMHSDVSLMFYAISENFSVIKCLYEFRSDSCHSIDSSFFFRIHSFQLVTHSKQSSLKSAQLTNCIFFIFCLYVVLIWYCATSNSEFHFSKVSCIHQW
jgi:hypothetical protein